MSDFPLEEGLPSFPVKEPGSVGRPGYTWEKKMEVVSRFMLLGNMRVVAEQTGVAPETLAAWKRSDWWPEMVETIRRQSKTKTNTSLTKIIEQSLDVVQERLENGDFVFNQKTGQVVRKPVGVKEASTIANNLLQRQVQIEELMEKTQTNGDTVADTLKLIAQELQKNNKKEKPIDLPFVEVTK